MFPDGSTPPPATREHMAQARRDLEEALKDPKAKKRLKQASAKIARDLESDVRRIENGTNGAHP